MMITTGIIELAVEDRLGDVIATRYSFARHMCKLVEAEDEIFDAALRHDRNLQVEMLSLLHMRARFAASIPSQ